MSELELQPLQSLQPLQPLLEITNYSNDEIESFAENKFEFRDYYEIEARAFNAEIEPFAEDKFEFRDYYEIEAGAFTSYNKGTLAEVKVNGRSVGAYFQQRYNFNRYTSQSPFVGLYVASSAGKTSGTTFEDISFTIDKTIKIGIIDVPLVIPVTVPIPYTVASTMIGKVLVQFGRTFHLPNRNFISPYIETGFIIPDVDANLVAYYEFTSAVPGISIGVGLDTVIYDRLHAKIAANVARSPYKVAGEPVYSLGDIQIGFGYKFL
jgi:hypothetical protein